MLISWRQVVNYLRRGWQYQEVLETADLQQVTIHTEKSRSVTDGISHQPQHTTSSQTAASSSRLFLYRKYLTHLKNSLRLTLLLTQTNSFNRTINRGKRFYWVDSPNFRQYIPYQVRLSWSGPVC